jgi:hypothetical protein
MRTIKTYRKVGAFYITWEEDFATYSGKNVAIQSQGWHKLDLRASNA